MRFKICLPIMLFSLILYPLFSFSQSNEEFNKVKEDEIRRHIQTYRMWEMTKALDLTEDQVAKIFPTLNRIEKEKADLNKQIGLEIRELKELLDIKEYNLDQIKEKLEKIKELKGKIQEKDAEIEKLLEDNLTVEQQAKYIIFSVKFMRDLREKLNRARQLSRKKMMLQRKNRR